MGYAALGVVAGMVATNVQILANETEEVESPADFKEVGTETTYEVVDNYIVSNGSVMKSVETTDEVVENADGSKTQTTIVDGEIRYVYPDVVENQGEEAAFNDTTPVAIDPTLSKVEGFIHREETRIERYEYYLDGVLVSKDDVSNATLDYTKEVTTSDGSISYELVDENGMPANGYLLDGTKVGSHADSEEYKHIYISTPSSSFAWNYGFNASYPYRYHTFTFRGYDINGNRITLVGDSNNVYARINEELTYDKVIQYYYTTEDKYSTGTTIVEGDTLQLYDADLDGYRDVDLTVTFWENDYVQLSGPISISKSDDSTLLVSVPYVTNGSSDVQYYTQEVSIDDFSNRKEATLEINVTPTVYEVEEGAFTLRMVTKSEIPFMEVNPIFSLSGRVFNDSEIAGILNRLETSTGQGSTYAQAKVLIDLTTINNPELMRVSGIASISIDEVQIGTEVYNTQKVWGDIGIENEGYLEYTFDYSVRDNRRYNIILIMTITYVNGTSSQRAYSVLEGLYPSASKNMFDGTGALVYEINSYDLFLTSAGLRMSKNQYSANYTETTSTDFTTTVQSDLTLGKAETFTVKYSVIEDSSYGLPTDVVIPSDGTYEYKDLVRIASDLVTSWTTSDGTEHGIKGTWTFISWDREDFIITEDTIITGQWVFTPSVIDDEEDPKQPIVPEEKEEVIHDNPTTVEDTSVQTGVEASGIYSFTSIVSALGIILFRKRK